VRARARKPRARAGRAPRGAVGKLGEEAGEHRDEGLARARAPFRLEQTEGRARQPEQRGLARDAAARGRAVVARGDERGADGGGEEVGREEVGRELDEHEQQPLRQRLEHLGARPVAEQLGLREPVGDRGRDRRARAGRARGVGAGQEALREEARDGGGRCVQHWRVRVRRREHAHERPEHRGEVVERRAGGRGGRRRRPREERAECADERLLEVAGKLALETQLRQPPAVAQPHRQQHGRGLRADGHLIVGNPHRVLPAGEARTRWGFPTVISHQTKSST
jgi:hypothetical protein